MTDTTLDRNDPRTDKAENIPDGWVLTGYFDPDFHESIDQELDRLESLAPNWDGQDAKEIHSEIIQSARRLAEELPSDLVQKPRVVPMAKGNLQFEWHMGDRSLEIEIEDSDTIHYLKWHPEECVEEEGLFPLAETTRIVNLIRWFTRSIADV